jgi:hypothetical protein
LELQLPLSSRGIYELGHADLSNVNSVSGCADPPGGKLGWVGKSGRITAPMTGKWGGLEREEVVHVCVLENESNLLRFNLPIYPVHRRPNGADVIVRSGLVRYEGGDMGDDSEKLAVGYTLSDFGASHKFVLRGFIRRLEVNVIRLTWRESGTMRVTTARKTSLVPFR